MVRNLPRVEDTDLYIWLRMLVEELELAEEDVVIKDELNESIKKYINGSLNGFLPEGSSLDSAPLGTSFLDGYYTNAPSDYIIIGILFTICTSKGEKAQLLFDGSAISWRTYDRIYWENWSTIEERYNRQEIMDWIAKEPYLKTTYAVENDISQNTDILTITKPGQYRIESASAARTMINLPSESGGVLDVITTYGGSSASYRTYVYRDAAGNWYIRMVTPSSTGSWKQFVTDKTGMVTEEATYPDISAEFTTSAKKVSTRRIGRNGIVELNIVASSAIPTGRYITVANVAEKPSYTVMQQMFPGLQIRITTEGQVQLYAYAGTSFSGAANAIRANIPCIFAT